MIIKEIKLQNFRSYKDRSFPFANDLNLVIGANTTGKTNLFEAIYLLATGRSFRASLDREMIRWAADLARVQAKLTVNDEMKELEIMLTTGLISGHKTPYKTFTASGVGKRMIDFVGMLKVVLFWPEDLGLVIGSPSVRRNYLDSVLAQVDREYRRCMISYEKGLRQRNRVLEKINQGQAHHHQLTFWDQLLIKNGDYLTQKREEYLEFTNQQQIDGPDINIYQLLYDKSVISEGRLWQYQEEEVAAKATLVGPHRDDIKFKIREGKNLLDLSRYGSRGEQRLGILWLKLCELSFMEKACGDRPVLLLDDIFSELDHRHIGLVMEIIPQQQTIIAIVDAEHLDGKTISRGNTICLDP